VRRYEPIGRNPKNPEQQAINRSASASIQLVNQGSMVTAEKSIGEEQSDDLARENNHPKAPEDKLL
jgi:hypothetical protein